MCKNKVSCIMPTANRPQYIPITISNFLSQDYEKRELIIVDNGLEPIQKYLPTDSRIKYFFCDKSYSVGVKRNIACEHAEGDIIMHWDDDDWRASDWISKQVYFLINSGADISGIEHVNFYSVITNTLWKGTALNRNSPYTKGWLNGATLIYRRSFWQKYPFKDLTAGEDSEFLESPGASIYAHDYIDGFVAVLHSKNTTRKYFENPVHKKSPF